MKLLLLDYISYSGHRNFNEIHIKALHDSGHFLTLLGRKGQFDNISIKNNVQVKEMPSCFYGDYPITPISFRIAGIASLLWVKTHIKLKEYDAIIILTYDILSLFVFRTSVPVFLINHNNVPQLWSKIKLSLTRGLPFNYIHIALNKDMESHLRKLLPSKQVFHVPHGICPPSADMEKPSFIRENERFLFCPVNRNYDTAIVEEIFGDMQLNTYLKENGIKLYVKEKLKENCNDVIKCVPQNIDNKQYNFMLQHAIAVILPYGKGFKYRCSGIFFECVSQNTPIITTKLKSMAEYEEDIEMKMFTTVRELIDAIKYYQYYKPKEICLTKFEPKKYWDKAIAFVY